LRKHRIEDLDLMWLAIHAFTPSGASVVIESKLDDSKFNAYFDFKNKINNKFGIKTV